MLCYLQIKTLIINTLHIESFYTGNQNANVKSIIKRSTNNHFLMTLFT